MFFGGAEAAGLGEDHGLALLGGTRLMPVCARA